MRETCNGASRLLELPHAAGMSTSLTANPTAKDPFHKYTESWKNFSSNYLFVYGSEQKAPVRSDFDAEGTEHPASFEERMLPTSFANHTLRALFEGFDEVSANPHDSVMLEKYMLGYFVTYRHLLRDYSRRKLSKEGDALRAWSGIATLLQRFGHGREVVCGIPTAVMDLAILWTPVGDALGSRKQRNKRAEHAKLRYPTWSWTSMTDPIDLLVSQRWCATGEGLKELLDKIKDKRALHHEDEMEPMWQIGGRYVMRQLMKLHYGSSMSDECPFHSDVTWIGIQDGNEMISIRADNYIHGNAHLDEYPEPVLLKTPLPTEILHFKADMVPIKTLWRSGGHVITTNARSWYADVEQVMKQSTSFSLLRSVYQYLTGALTNASWAEWKQIVPDREQKELLNNMGFVYDELTEDKLTTHHRDPELVQDISKIYVVAMSTIRAFPPSTFYWQYIGKTFESWLTPHQFRQWGLIGSQPWSTKNVMVVNIDEDGLARRICVAHTSAAAFQTAKPERKYVKLC